MTSMSTAETSNERVRIPSVVIPNEDIEANPAAYRWYSEPDAGGYELRYGKLAGKKLNELDESCVRWWMEESQSVRIRCAAQAYLDGLEEYATDHYGEFLVPHRSKWKNHRGVRIDRCRDKEFFEYWLHRRYHDLHTKYPIYFKAVKQFLDNPSHHVARRDVGEHTGLDSGDESFTPVNINQGLGFSYRLGGASQSTPIAMGSALGPFGLSRSTYMFMGTPSVQSSDVDEEDEEMSGNSSANSNDIQSANDTADDLASYEDNEEESATDPDVFPRVDRRPGSQPVIEISDSTSAAPSESESSTSSKVEALTTPKRTRKVVSSDKETDCLARNIAQRMSDSESSVPPKITVPTTPRRSHKIVLSDEENDVEPQTRSPPTRTTDSDVDFQFSSAYKAPNTSARVQPRWTMKNPKSQSFSKSSSRARAGQLSPTSPAKKNKSRRLRSASSSLVQDDDAEYDASESSESDGEQLNVQRVTRSKKYMVKPEGSPKEELQPQSSWNSEENNTDDDQDQLKAASPDVIELSERKLRTEGSHESTTPRKRKVSLKVNTQRQKIKRHIVTNSDSDYEATSNELQFGGDDASYRPETRSQGSVGEPKHTSLHVVRSRRLPKDESGSDMDVKNVQSKQSPDVCIGLTDIASEKSDLRALQQQQPEAGPSSGAQQWKRTGSNASQSRGTVFGSSKRGAHKLIKHEPSPDLFDLNQDSVQINSSSAKKDSNPRKRKMKRKKQAEEDSEYQPSRIDSEEESASSVDVQSSTESMMLSEPAPAPRVNNQLKSNVLKLDCVLMPPRPPHIQAYYDEQRAKKVKADAEVEAPMNPATVLKSIVHADEPSDYENAQQSTPRGVRAKRRRVPSSSEGEGSDQSEGSDDSISPSDSVSQRGKRRRYGIDQDARVARNDTCSDGGFAGYKRLRMYDTL